MLTSISFLIGPVDPASGQRRLSRSSLPTLWFERDNVSRNIIRLAQPYDQIHARMRVADGRYDSLVTELVLLTNGTKRRRIRDFTPLSTGYDMTVAATLESDTTAAIDIPRKSRNGDND